jgi:CBS domain-containing protein
MIFPSVTDRAFELAKMMSTVRDIMSKDVVTINPVQDMAWAARIMGSMHIGSLVVFDEKPVGIVTERDLLSDIIALGRDPKRVLVRSVMSSPLITIRPDASIKEAAKLMIRRRGRLVVMGDSELAGIITASDLVKTLPDSESTYSLVSDYMTKKVFTSDESSLLIDLAKAMGEKRIGSVIITEHGKPTGIFTERDLLTTFMAEGKELNVPVGEFASKPLLVSNPQINIHEAASIMSTHGIKRLPLINDEDKLIGIITARDLVEVYSK